MKLAWILWLANHVLPQPSADQLCLATTVYLEARNQSTLGQRAVAEVALRRLEKGIWGENLCAVVTAPKQFAPTLVSPNYWIRNAKAWQRAVDVAFQAQREWKETHGGKRHPLVPGACPCGTRSARSCGPGPRAWRGRRSARGRRRGTRRCRRACASTAAG